MSNEVSVAEPLSGTEIVEAIVNKVREQLRRDCYLSPNSAYEYFFGEIKISIRAIDVGREADVDKTVSVELGKVPEDPKDPRIEEDHSQQDIDRAPPNVVRRESGQSVPVQTEDGAGRPEIKRVKYARPGEKIAK